MDVAAMNTEAVLDDAIDPWSAAPARSGEPESILLTGATGYLGAFLLAELAEQTAATIYCLVRASDEAHGRERLRANLQGYGLPPGVADRATVLLGDLQRPLLGLGPETHERLAEEVDLIHHCGASVKWTYPYAALKPANVDGTHEVLRLAASQRLKPVHFVSTVGVFSSPEFGGETVLETESLDRSGPLAIGYAQTKWVAERLVTMAACRGLPATIYRPNIAWHSATGAFNAADHLMLMLGGCLEMGSIPEMQWEVAGAAVDYVARAIVYLATQPESTGRVFHLVAPRPISWDRLCELLEHKRGLRRVSFAEWCEDFLTRVVNGWRTPLTALYPLLSESLMNRVRIPRFDDRTTIQHLAGTDVRCPELDGAMLDRLLRRMADGGPA